MSGDQIRWPYINKLARAQYPQRRDAQRRADWQHARCHTLKHDPKALDQLIAEVTRLADRCVLSQTLRDEVRAARSYFDNHRHQKDYPTFVAEGLPIGSGVTEAACKTLVKQRLCASGMRWKTQGGWHRAQPARARAYRRTLGAVREKIDQFGAECCC